MDNEKFTGEQMRRIDELLESNFDNATQEDIELYARWQVQKARTSEEFEAMRKSWDDEAKEKIAIAREQSENAHAALETLVNMAIERFERMD